MGRIERWNLLRALGDAGIALACFYLAFRLRIALRFPFTHGPLPGGRLGLFGHHWLWVVLAQLLLLYFLGLYDLPRPLPRLELAQRLLGAVTFETLVLIGGIFFADRTFPRSVLILFALLDLVALFVWRSLLQRLYRVPQRRVVLVGGGPMARELAESIGRHRWHGLTLAGYVTREGTGGGEDPADPDPLLGRRLGSTTDLPELLASGMIDDVILAGTPDPWQARLIDSLSGARPERSSVLLVPGPFESLIGRMRYRWVRDIPLIEVVRESEWHLRRPTKRLLDLALGSLLMILALPLMLTCAVLIRLTSPGPVLYRQVRIGRGLETFELLKFRTMRRDAEPEGIEMMARREDPRFTPVGALLRRFRVDELPQLWSVLAGTMSLVGPRPERPGFVERYLAEVPGYAERFSVPPGLTGLAQVNGDYDSSPQNKLRYDLAYIANRSLWLDLSILFRTVKIVLTSRGV